MSLLDTSTSSTSAGNQAPAAPEGAQVANSGAATTSTSSAGFVNPDGSFTPGWTDRLSDEAIRPTVAKYNTVGDLAKGYHHLSQLLGSKASAVTVPGADAKPEEIANFHRAMGVPEKVEDYQFKPAQLPEGIEWDEAAATLYAEVGHKNGIPPNAMAALAEVQMAQEVARAQAAHEAEVQQLETAKAELQQEYGGKFGTVINSVAELVKGVGIDANSPGFADPNVIRVIERLSNKLPKEDVVPKGQAAPVGQDPRDIMTNPANPLHQRYLNNEPSVRKMVADLLTQQQR